jgi:hypothetical protein
MPPGARLTGMTMGLGIGPGVGALLVGSAETFDEMTVGLVPPPLVFQQNIRMHDAIFFSQSGGVRNLNLIPASKDHDWRLQSATATKGGWIVGWGSFTSNGRRVCRAFRWTALPGPSPDTFPSPGDASVSTAIRPRASVVDLGTIPSFGEGACDLSGYHPYVADAVNSRGEIVGSVRRPEVIPGGAFFYSDSTGMIDLTAVISPRPETLGYRLRTATGINDQGQIVGTFTKPGETQIRAYRLSLPPTFTSGPVAQFDWIMKPHFPGTDRALAKAPPGVSCSGMTATCTTPEGNPGCRGPNPPSGLEAPCVASSCQPGTVAWCRASCGSNGVETCGDDGRWQACLVGNEICDGADNNCDGQVDEDSICTRPRSSFQPWRRGFDVTLDARLSQSPKSRIFLCAWELPDGVEGATGCVANVVFPHEGTFSVKLTVTAENGTRASERHDVTIRNVIIASIGDSIASGEGSPDVSGTPPTYDLPNQMTSPGTPPTWWNQRCHRSLHSGHALTARAIEEADPRTSVTFISRACSGAGVIGGLLERYGGIEQVAMTIPGTEGDGDRDQWLRPQVAAIRSLLGTRKADALLLQAGANDAEFAAIIEMCAYIEGIGKPRAFPCEGQKAFGLAVAGVLEQEVYPELVANLSDLTEDPARLYIADYPDPMRLTPDVQCPEVRLEGALEHKSGGLNLPLGILVTGRPLDDDVILVHDDVVWASQTFLPRLNTAIASTSGWTHGPGVNTEFIGRPICSPQRAFVQYDESLIRQRNYKGVLHPNIAGQRIYASKFCPIVARDLGFSIGRCPRIP